MLPSHPFPSSLLSLLTFATKHFLSSDPRGRLFSLSLPSPPSPRWLQLTPLNVRSPQSYPDANRPTFVLQSTQNSEECRLLPNHLPSSPASSAEFELIYMRLSLFPPDFLDSRRAIINGEQERGSSLLRKVAFLQKKREGSTRGGARFCLSFCRLNFLCSFPSNHHHFQLPPFAPSSLLYRVAQKT